MQRLSVIVITHNEAHNIRECLRSVQFAHEVVVVDWASDDGTADLARAEGARVLHTDEWPGFGPQKNRALDACTGDWVLSLDADEAVTPALADSIRRAIEAPACDAYEINRRSLFCGRWMAHSGWYPDRVVRLVRRGTARFSDDIVHERLLPSGAVGRLDGELRHRSMPDFESVLVKMDRYSTAGALSLHRRGVRGSFRKAFGHGAWAFLRTYVLRRGFLDGRHGFALALSNAEGTYYRYLKLWLLQQRGDVRGDR